MKQRLLAMVFALFAMQMAVWAQELSGYCGDPNVNEGKDVTWELSQDGVDRNGNPAYTLILRGNGAQVTEPWELYFSSITDLIICDGVTEVKPALFSESDNLNVAFIPFTMTSIPDAMFAFSSLAYVDIEPGITRIERRSFLCCQFLTVVIIPHTVTSIGHIAFKDCESLTDILCFSPVPPTLEFDEYGVGPFEGIAEDAVLYVPDVEAYKASDWAKCFSRIEKYVDPMVGVPTIEADKDAPATIYDLSGRRVEVPVEGRIYIVNGKAVVWR